MESVARWLKQYRAEVVAQLLQRICAELPDYRQRPVDQLTMAAGAAYDQWCDTVLTNDLLRHAREADAVISQNIARGVDPTQMARIPALTCEVVLAMLGQAGPAVDPSERAEFTDRAQRMTTSILGIGGMRIAREVLKKTIDESSVPPPGPAAFPDA